MKSRDELINALAPGLWKFMRERGADVITPSEGVRVLESFIATIGAACIEAATTGRCPHPRAGAVCLYCAAISGAVDRIAALTQPGGR